MNFWNFEGIFYYLEIKINAQDLRLTLVIFGTYLLLNAYEKEYSNLNVFMNRFRQRGG